jgi:omega-amidase
MRGSARTVAGMQVPVVVAQIPVCWSVPRNVETVTAVIAEADAGDLLVLPEGALSGYDGELSGLADLDTGQLRLARRAVAGAASRAKVHVVCGTLLYEDRQWWNTAIYFSPHGQVLYRKVNLATHERGRLAAGSALPTIPMALPSGGLRAGIQLCREIRFPEQWSCLARQGAQVLIYLTYAANPAQPAGVWRAHLVSRAAETQRFVVAANVADPKQHCPSMIISPRGEVLAEAPAGAVTMLRHRIDVSEVRDDYLAQQRGDVVKMAYVPGGGGSGR